MAIYPSLADILDYPVHPITRQVEGCAAELALRAPDAHAHLVEFQSALTGESLGQIQETYTNAFDLRPDCTTNLGYHLFGDDGRRGLFLAELKGRMEARGIAPGFELPDHISLLLRYMHIVQEERSTLIEDCMLPAVSRMVEILGATENPYKHALRALLSLLQYEQEALSAQAEAIEG